MELAQYILTGLLYVIIYGLSTLFIFQFLLDISIAFEKHCNCTTSTKHSVIKTETLTEKSKIQISNKKKSSIYNQTDDCSTVKKSPIISSSNQVATECFMMLNPYFCSRLAIAVALSSKNDRLLLVNNKS